MVAIADIVARAAAKRDARNSSHHNFAGGSNGTRVGFRALHVDTTRAQLARGGERPAPRVQREQRGRSDVEVQERETINFVHSELVHEYWNHDTHIRYADRK